MSQKTSPSVGVHGFKRHVLENEDTESDNDTVVKVIVHSAVKDHTVAPTSDGMLTAPPGAENLTSGMDDNNNKNDKDNAQTKYDDADGAPEPDSGIPSEADTLTDSEDDSSHADSEDSVGAYNKRKASLNTRPLSVDRLQLPHSSDSEEEHKKKGWRHNGNKWRAQHFCSHYGSKITDSD